MKATAKPKPPAPVPPRVARIAGNQKDFEPAAKKLAEDLGWVGEDEWELHEIRVRDARRYIIKVMHEHFQAAANELPQPDTKAACQHLAVDTPDEQAAIDAALKAAYEAGKGAVVTTVPVRRVSLDGDIAASASAALGKLNEAGSK